MLLDDASNLPIAKSLTTKESATKKTHDICVVAYLGSVFLFRYLIPKVAVGVSLDKLANSVNSLVKRFSVFKSRACRHVAKLGSLTILWVELVHKLPQTPNVCLAEAYRLHGEFKADRLDKSWK
jgi:hypothetical protein